MVVDGVWATVGSTNLDRRSFALNDELNLVVYDATVARQLQQVFEADLQESREVTLENWKRRDSSASSSSCCPVRSATSL
jgi:cardiolipin synthase